MSNGNDPVDPAVFSRVFISFLFLLQVRTLFVSGLPMDTKPRELYLLFRAYEVSNLNLPLVPTVIRSCQLFCPLHNNVSWTMRFSTYGLPNKADV